MVPRSRIALNRIACPRLGIEEFFAISAELGLGKVELRNDLAGGGVIDGLAPARVAELATKHHIEILSINALQKFNLPSALAKATRELEALIELSRAIGCRAVVLCPNNDTADMRSAGQSQRDTVAALKAFRGRFEASGVLGYVEPLGFPECSLRSALSAVDAIREVGSGSYRVLIDTFHHHLGPDTAGEIDEKLDVSMVGLVHVSGVESDAALGTLRDEHRVLVTAEDRVDNVGQLARLIARGYAGDVSLEPFAPQVQDLDRATFREALRRTIGILGD
jgi:2-keto-myo-inositol isomerase